jgi:transposase
MVVNPIITHAFFKMELNRNKTDKADAQLIARYCEHVVLTGDYEKKSYQPKGADYEAMQRLVTRCDQLEKSKTQENNHLEASANKQTTRSIKRLQKAIDNESSQYLAISCASALSVLLRFNSILKKA